MTRLLEAGLVLYKNRQYASAEKLFMEAARTTGAAKAWHLVGVARHALGNHAGAIDALRRASSLSQADPDVACALATVLGESGAWQEAEETLRLAMQRSPDHAQLHFNLGCVLERRGDAALQALEHYDAALAAAPRHAHARLNRGAIRLRLDRVDDALADFRQLGVHHPEMVQARINENRALLLLHKDEEALRAAEEGLQRAPGDKELLLGQAIALASMGRLEEAAHPLSLARPTWSALRLYIGRAIERQDECDWRDRNRLVAAMRGWMDAPANALEAAEAALVHRCYALPLENPEIRRLAELVAARYERPSGPPQFRQPARRTDRIRLGILSAGVSVHPDFLLLRRILKAMDRDRFEVLLYALNIDDGSAERKELARSADAFTDLSRLDSTEAVRRLRADELDLLIDTGAYFNGGRPEILKARVAPVQAAYLSVPGTYGPGLADYRVSDARATPPDTQIDWEEKLVLLPSPHFIYDNPVVPSGCRDRAAHGLPEKALILACFNQSWKIEPEVFASWMRLLSALPDALLWLLDSGPRPTANLRRAAAASGVDPQRLRFSPRVPLQAHLERLQAADLFLDCFHYNAVTTALDALWAGVPVVTKIGRTMASRLAASFVGLAGHEDIVARTTEEYERLALELGRDHERRERYRRALVSPGPRSRLFVLDEGVRALELGLAAMVDRHRRGLPPALIDLSTTGSSYTGSS